MFIASTAIEQFWNKSDELLFLGRWCIQHLSSKELERLRYTILQNPWNDRCRLSAAINYLDEFSEKSLPVLSEYLNRVNQVNLDTRYWRVLVSPWLVQYLHLLYDRYTILTDAFAKYPQLETTLLDSSCFWRPPDTLSLHKACSDDQYNLQVFSSLLRGMGYKFLSQNYEADSTPKHEGKTFSARVKQAVVSAECELLTTIGGFRPDTVGMYSMHWRWPLKLSLLTGFRFFPFTLKSVDTSMPAKPRPVLTFQPANQFESIFWSQVSHDLPTLYVEGFEKARRLMLKSKAQFLRVLVSQSAWHFDEPFKFFAAEACIRGKSLFAAQHGGGYGMARHIAPELHEDRVADASFVWGWADSKHKHYNLSSPQLGQLKRGSNKEPSILFISTANPLYLNRFHSSPLGDQWAEYFEWQLRFLERLSVSNRRFEVYRPYPDPNWGFNITTQLKMKYPDVQIHRGALRGKQRCRVAVIDHCGTTFLQMLSANIPTIIYWDPARWEVRNEAKSYMERLASSGIFWSSPEDAAGAVERVYDNVRDWWDSEEVQDARTAFCTRFAMRPDAWVRAFRDTLQEVMVARGFTQDVHCSGGL